MNLARWLEQNGAHHDVVQWAAPFGEDWERAWRECPRGDWLLGIAAKRGAPRIELVRAAHACASFAREYAPEDERRIDAAMDAAMRWIEGQDDPEARARAAEDVERAIDQAADPAAQSVAIAAFAALRSIDAPEEAASSAAAAVQAAVLDVGDCATMSAMGYAQSTCADRVREHVAFR